MFINKGHQSMSVFVLKKKLITEMLIILFILLLVALLCKWQYSEQIYVDNEYLYALKTADKYLYAWMTRNGSMAYDLISDNIKKQYKDREDFVIQFAGLSNPHHEAFEIVGNKQQSKERIRFKVWMYYHYSGENIPPYKRPDSDVYIELIKIDEAAWVVDKVFSGRKGGK